MHDGIFEKFWSKAPPKRKQVPGEPPPKPPSMSKVGTCKLTIEPHIFDVTLYIVKEVHQPQHGAQIHIERPHLQYGPPQQYGPTYGQPATPMAGRSPTPVSKAPASYPSPVSQSP